MSRLLVFLQFLFIFLLAYPSSPPQVGYVSLGLFSAGLAVFFAALAAMKRKTFTVLPEPKPGAVLITSGIYAVVRHPMYLSVILCAAGALLFFPAWWKGSVILMLLAVLWLKIRREEKYLLARYDGYAAYREKTSAIIPYIL